MTNQPNVDNNTNTSNIVKKFKLRVNSQIGER